MAWHQTCARRISIMYHRATRIGVTAKYQMLRLITARLRLASGNIGGEQQTRNAPARDGEISRRWISKKRRTSGGRKQNGAAH